MIALLREVSARLEQGELSHLKRAPIDLALARTQHAHFSSVLSEFGVKVEFVPPLPEQPDGVFIEDAAVVLPEVAIITRPGAASRESEVDSVIPLLARHRRVLRIRAPATLDGGDVLRIGRTLFIGRSMRTTADAVAAVRNMVAPFDYNVCPVDVRGCLHLKSAVTFIPPNFLVVNPAWVQPNGFGDNVVVTVDPGEPFAANTLSVVGTTLVSASFPKTEERLSAVGVATRRLEISEFEKAEGGLTCLALLLTLSSG